MKIKRTLPFKLAILVFTSLLCITSCSKDDASRDSENLQHQDISSWQDEAVISYADLKFKLTQIDFESELSNLLKSDFIVNINTDEITEITSEDTNLYYFDVTTKQEDAESETRLLYYVTNNEIKYGLLRFSPVNPLNTSRELVGQATDNGILDLLDKDGNVEVSIETPNGFIPDDTILNRLGVPCVIIIEPIYVDCYGAACPCPDGNGTIGGWNIISSGCIGGGGGGGSTGNPPTNGNPGGGGTGSGGGNPNYGDLPTTAGGWNLFMNLLDITGPNDSLYFDSNIPQNQALIFNNFNEYETFLNNFDIHTLAPVQNADGTYTTKFIYGDLFLADLHIDVKQLLCNNITGQDYMIQQINTNLVGTKVFGMNWSGLGFDYSIEGDEATLDLYGNISYLVKTPYGDFIQTFYKHFVMKIGIYTGFPRDMYELD